MTINFLQAGKSEHLTVIKFNIFFYQVRKKLLVSSLSDNIVEFFSIHLWNDTKTYSGF